MSTETGFLDEMENAINTVSMSDEDRSKLLCILHRHRDGKLNIMLTGQYGCGKSSTADALFGKKVSETGAGAEPSSAEISSYEQDGIVVWDCPGLGVSPSEDSVNTKNIVDKLHEKDSEGNALIDLVLVIIDGSSRDMGTSFELINEVIIPALGEEGKGKIIVAINKCDMAMGGRHFDLEKNKPDEKLMEFLEDKTWSVHDRILNASGLSIRPICYAAGFREDDSVQPPYNMSKLFACIRNKMPAKKRRAFAGRTADGSQSPCPCSSLAEYLGSFPVTEDGIGSAAAMIGRAIGTMIGQIKNSTGERD